MQEMSAKKFAPALEKLEELEATTAPPDLPMLYANIAFLEIQLEMYRKAVKTCTKAIEMSPSTLRPHYLKGLALMRMEKPDKAREAWRAGLEAANDTSDALLYMEMRDLVEGRAHRTLGSVAVAPLEGTPAGGQGGAGTCTAPPPPPASTSTATAVASSSAANVKPAASSTASPPPPPSTSSSPLVLPSDPLVRGPPTMNLDALHKAVLAQLRPEILAAIRPNIANASGDDRIDDLIAFGYLQVNTGKLSMAQELFEEVIRHRSDVVDAHVGLGSAYALGGDLDKAIKCFTQAIGLDPSHGDSWKRRGQTRAAKGLIKDAMDDFARALKLSDDPDVYTQRGLIYHKIRNFRRAVVDFDEAIRRGEDSAQLHNFRALCLGQLGDWQEALVGYEAAVQKDPAFREAKVNHAQLLKEQPKRSHVVSGVAARPLTALNAAATVSAGSSSQVTNVVARSSSYHRHYHQPQLHQPPHMQRMSTVRRLT